MTTQVLTVGDGFLVLYERAMKRQDIVELGEHWRRSFPDVPIAVLPEARYVQVEGQSVVGYFEFEGEKVTQEVIDGFREFWAFRGAFEKHIPPAGAEGRPTREADHSNDQRLANPEGDAADAGSRSS